jgi:hypothetical protein
MVSLVAKKTEARNQYSTVVRKLENQ